MDFWRRSRSAETDHYPRFALALLALLCAGFAPLSALAAVEAWQTARWVKFAITSAGVVFFAYCAIGWFIRWRDRGSGR